MHLRIRISENLFFFVKNQRRNRGFDLDLARKASVKDIIQSLGIPHTEVGKIEFDGRTINFSFIPKRCGNLFVAGISPPFDVRKPGVLRARPLGKIRFVADVNVMKLGKLLLLLGFDTICSSRFSDQEIADISEQQDRIVLTRDTGLLNRKKIIYARRIRENAPYDQLAETLDFFGIRDEIRFFTRCSLCNCMLKPRQKSQVLNLLEPKTKKHFSRFFQCPQCKKVFWKGSHYDKIAEKLEGMNILVPHDRQ